ncbi:hypothetical protein AMECASPLE_035854 [Ameca splendens]|uniref:Uncharacterized protein n=1 Tax=Ameca splendens TaxID=208324 RepID=A0ABV1A2T7_9TELE
MKQKSLDGYIDLCEEIRCVHDSLMILLPVEDKEKHETWFKAKIMFTDEFIENVKEWVKSKEDDVFKNEGIFNIDDDINHDGVDNDATDPNDSVSNVGKHGNKSVTSNKSSTTSSAQIKAAAERAALIARMAVLKERHALEEQEQLIKRRKEQLDLETELAVSTAKLAVLQASDEQCHSLAFTDGMNSYFEKEKRKRTSLTTLNAMAKEYKPAACKITQQKNVAPTKSKLQTMDVRPKQPEMKTSAIKQHLDGHDQMHLEAPHILPHVATTAWNIKMERR